MTTEIRRKVRGYEKSPYGHKVVTLEECAHTYAIHGGDSIPNEYRCWKCEAELRKGTSIVIFIGSAGGLYLYDVELEGSHYGVCMIQRKNYGRPGHRWQYLIESVLNGQIYESMEEALGVARSNIEMHYSAYRDN